MAVYFLKHTAMGKGTYDKKGAVGHIGYILRKNGCIAHGASYMPDDYRQALGWAAKTYDHTRTNARVYDKIIVNLPRELTLEQHVGLVWEFCEAVTRGQTPYLWAIHGDKPKNPHAHIIIRDCHIRTKKRVAKLSDKGSSYKLRAIWQHLANAKLAPFSTAISRWGKNTKHFAYLNEQARIKTTFRPAAVSSSSLYIKPFPYAIPGIAAGKPEHAPIRSHSEVLHNYSELVRICHALDAIAEYTKLIEWIKTDIAYRKGRISDLLRRKDDDVHVARHALQDTIMTMEHFMEMVAKHCDHVGVKSPYEAELKERMLAKAIAAKRMEGLNFAERQRVEQSLRK